MVQTDPDRWRPRVGAVDSAIVESVNVLVVGAGQAGLATSAELTRRGVDHLVLERGRVGQSWRDRWDSFCLVTPNWSIQLPGGAYDGDDPDGYLERDAIVEHFERWAAAIHAPVREGVEVRAISEAPEGGFGVTTSDGEVHASRVVLASGAYQRPHLPAAETLPTSIERLDVSGYRNPGTLPPGTVMIVGGGQSGLQIAEELHQAGRDVVVACGRAPWLPRRLGGRDIVWWGRETGFLEQPVESLPDPSERLVANLQNSGRGGGHSLNYRTLRVMGVRLVGRFLGADDGHLTFADDLEASVAWGDQRYRMFMDSLRRYVADHGLTEPEIEEPEPFTADPPTRLPAAGFGSVIHASGYRPAYRDWLPWPEAFDALGFPIHRDGESTIVPGLYFVGVHFLRKRKSSLLIGVGEDAAIVADSIAAA
jgi:glycine/D-amino acid oxidase-like deaminating enzyme